MYLLGILVQPHIFVTQSLRLWSLHPKHLDSRGLVALWREGLLAQKVLRGKTRGYRHHPQLTRFRLQSNPRASIATYLRAVVEEAKQRGYSFDGSKIGRAGRVARIPVTRGQIIYELGHLTRKLYARDRKKYLELRNMKNPSLHPSFVPVPGKVEEWERV